MIRDVLENLVTLQGGLAIATPVVASVVKAYPYFPDPQREIPARSFQNEWTLGEVRAEQMVRTLPYVIRTQFLAGDVLHGERQEEIATAFFEEYVEAVCASVRTGGVFQGLILRLRGAEPTLGLIQRGGKAYVGFEAFLTVDLTTGFDWR